MKNILIIAAIAAVLYYVFVYKKTPAATTLPGSTAQTPTTTISGTVQPITYTPNWGAFGNL